MEEEKEDSRYQGEERFTFVVVGGGIAGVTCAETIAICCPDQSILLMTESNIIKTVANLEPVARYLHKFDVKERSLAGTAPGSSFLAPAIVTEVDCLKHVDAKQKFILTTSGKKIHFEYLCLCTGGKPRLIESDNHLVLGIRDTDSVLELQKRLKSSERVILVGNGGIASELAHELQGIEVHWVVKDNHIASTFIDPGAAFFFQQVLDKKKEEPVAAQDAPKAVVKRLRYDEITSMEAESKKGAALGPDWHKHFELTGGSGTAKNKPIIHFKALIKEMHEVFDAERNKTLMNVELTTGEMIKCDFVVSATGVDPRMDYDCEPALDLSADDHGIKVNEMMETTVERVYAAGDVCSSSWERAEHWFQMRLWTQARQMGSMAGRSMAAAFNKEVIYQDFCFELFGHVTQLFGMSLVLLGRYNGQGLGTNYEILLRTTPGHEYIKFILQEGKLRGAILIGNTELAETCENLILNGIDLTPFGDDILNPDIDIEDYFD